MAELLRRVERIQMFLADASNVQTPQLAPIHGGDCPLDLRIDDLILHRRTVTAHGQQRRAEQDRDVHSLGKNALQLDAQPVPNAALAAVATHQIIGLDSGRLSGLGIDDLGGDLLSVLLERLE